VRGDKPEPLLTVSVWAETCRGSSGKGSAEPPTSPGGPAPYGVNFAPPAARRGKG